jgi:two-component system, chemotaxis family, protein-glutamate methylesterase/glutaminase
MSLAVAPPSAQSSRGDDTIRVMVVDDAVVVRGLLARWLEAETGIALVASLRCGREAIEQVERIDPDVVILDIDMPDTDGITALPRLLAKKPELVVIMASTLTRRNAEISLRALSLGAADYIPKPESTRELAGSDEFRRELIDKIRVLGASRKRRASAAQALAAKLTAPAPALAPHPLGPGLRHVTSPGIAPPSDQGTIKLRPLPAVPPRVLLVGSSTGGPQALNSLLANIHGVIDQAPVLIVQHMPRTFTTILAEHLARASGRPVGEAVDGEPVRAGRVYLAPGGRHMRVVRRNGAPTIALDDGPPLNFCKPAVDPLFASAAEVWGARNLAVVLTGMGSDGASGAGEIVAAGGCVMAQDEASSVVWGMPGAVAHAGLCSAVLPLQEIAPRTIRMFLGARP